ncbi:hypothetical protein DRJ25_00190 [Candidatus Woesearchaeota archaeon]|nr:MAG: hypothetical protein DRJ25_00190 [Candidatus Woesearchaeota archaeon]
MLMFIKTLKENLKQLLPELSKKIDELEKPWEALRILGEVKIDENKINGEIEEGVIIKGKIILGKGSVIRSPARLEGNIIIGEGTIIGPYSFIRGNAVIGNECKIGSTEVKHSIILDNSNACHFNYIGDGVIGQRCNLGAGTKIANLRFDREEVKLRIDGEKIPLGTNKFGVVFENEVQTMCNSVLMPGSYVKEGSKINYKQK